MKPAVSGVRPMILFSSGAVGVALAALVYFLAARVVGLVHPLVPWREAEGIVFAVLLIVALIEMPTMVVGLRIFATRKVNPAFLYSLNIIYIAFAAVYAGAQVLLFGESTRSLLLLALCALRWASDWWIR